MTTKSAPTIAIACGGTGGHLFPGLAVAQQLVRQGCRATLLISPKEVDQQAVRKISGMEIFTLPAIGLTRGRVFAFAGGFIKSYCAAKSAFKKNPPQAALAMGGFTSAPPILAAKRLGAKTFLHESNTIPGRANRWLSRVVDQAFVGFEQTASRLHTRNATVTGTPVRPGFCATNAANCRAQLGLQVSDPVVMVVGGSQGATGINNLVVNSLGKFCTAWQFVHLTGPGDAERVRRAYAEKKLRAVVHAFFDRMDLALGAATVVISRAGASSLAEIAAMRVPPILIPFPAATDNHQFFNARAFEESGAARLLEQKTATPEMLGCVLRELITSETARDPMRQALAKWHTPDSAEQIAAGILSAIACRVDGRALSEEAKRQKQKMCGAAERQEFSNA